MKTACRLISVYAFLGMASMSLYTKSQHGQPDNLFGSPARKTPRPLPPWVEITTCRVKPTTGRVRSQPSKTQGTVRPQPKRKRIKKIRVNIITVAPYNMKPHWRP
eukprot:8070422-Pyramimonas_sp.AAC.1